MKHLNTLTKDDLLKRAPLVLADKPTREVSSKYVFANTETVVDDLARLGWMPTDASQRSARKKDSPSRFSPHMVKFANPDIVVQGKGDDLSYPQIILHNRHDGLGSFKFMAGMFRLVCSNGLVIATSTFASVGIPHKGYTFEELREVVSKRVEAIPETVDFMNKMKEVKLTGPQKHMLALDGLLLRSGITPGSDASKDFKPEDGMIAELLKPNRKEDGGDDLWSVFNVVQEKVIKGGWNSNRKVKPITSFEKDLALNQQLFSSALKLVEG